MGGLRTSPTDALDTHAHLLPAVLTVDKWCHQALVRMAMLPYEHPLNKVIKQKNIGKIKKHKGLIHQLTKWYKLDIRAIKKLPVAMCNP